MREMTPASHNQLMAQGKIMSDYEPSETVEHSQSSAGELIQAEESTQIQSFPWSGALPGSYQGVSLRNGPLIFNPHLLGARNDLEAVSMWLRSVSEYSGDTERAYRREAERLLLWASAHLGKSLSELNRGDYIAYLDFIKDPQPATDWIMDRRYPRHDKRWRPFMGPLTPKSARYAQGVIYGMLEWLKNAEWLSSNLMPSVRRRRATSTRNAPKSLTPAQCQIVEEAIEQRPQTTDTEIAYYERLRWMFAFFRGMAARASEAAESPMSSFTLEATGHGTALTWRVFGKGRVAGIDDSDSVPVRPSVLSALHRVRQFFGLPPYPAHAEATPIIPSFATMGRDGSIDITNANPLTESAIYKIFDQLFAEAAVLADARGMDQDAAMLRHRSTHSLRHTAIREFIDDTGDLSLAQRFARHNEISTTMLYASPHYDALSDALKKMDARDDG